MQSTPVRPPRRTSSPKPAALNSDTKSAAPTTELTIESGERKRSLQEAVTCRETCLGLAELLHEASQTDEAEEHGGNSSRLLRLAAQTAERCALLAWCDRAPEDEIYNVAALMSAAFRVPGDVAGPKRSKLVSEAWGELLLLTESDDRADIDDAIYGERLVERQNTPQAAADAYVLRESAGLEAIALGQLVSWVSSARDVLRDLELSASLSEPFADLLRDHRIWYRDPEWREETSDGLTHVLMRQRNLIEQMFAAEAA